MYTLISFETVTSHNLEIDLNYIAHVVFVLHSAMKTQLYFIIAIVNVKLLKVNS